MLDYAATEFREEPYCFRKTNAGWTPASFAILPQPFTEANRMINSTMKMVRHRITEAYADDLAYLYTDEGHRRDNPRNRERLAALFGVSA